jgi:hypothetical protein
MNDSQFTTLAEVEAAHLAGKKVYWKNLGYEVTENFGEFIVLCSMNGCAFGLTKSYKPSDFFTA